MDNFESDDRQIDGRGSLFLVEDVKDVMDGEEK